MRLPSGAFGGLGNIITSGLGILSFGVRISHSATVAPGFPSLSAIFVTLPRFLYFVTSNAFISAGVLSATARATIYDKTYVRKLLIPVIEKSYIPF